MGGQHSKDKHRKSTPLQDNAKEELTKSLSYHFNDEGTSVDNDSADSTQEVLAQEESATLPPLPEEYPEDEPEPSVMSGLPGETVPESQATVKNELCDDTSMETEAHSKPDHLKDSAYFTSYVAKLGTMVEQLEEPDQLYSQSSLTLNLQDNISEEGQDTQDGIICKAGSNSSNNLQDIKIANENYCMPMHFDTEGRYKKKVTVENEDNRCCCPLENSDENPIHKQIFTNVIFLPDKSKGASPKRYGPKRLGSIYDSISEDDECINSNMDEYMKYSLDDEKPLHGHSIDTISESKTYSNYKDESDSKKKQKELTGSGNDSLQTERTDFEERTNDENSNVYAYGQVNEPEELTFVEDHFGLYTGSIAEGISKDFQAQVQSTSKETGSELNQSITSSDTKEENKNDENRLSENVRFDISSGNFKQHQLIQRQNDLIEHKADNVEISHRPNVHTAKTDEKMCKDTIKDEQKADEQICEQEVIEICRKCKEPGDLCLCLFPVMYVTVSGQKIPHFSYLRYLSIGEKEINWTALKSAQALFIKGLKSYKTEISEDNRVVFEFCLPTYKGFFGPDQRQSEPEICEDDIFLKGKNMVTVIEQKFKVNFTGTQLSGSIDSNRNIMINDFDECSEDDEEINDDNDDENLSESDENDRDLIDVEYHGNCSDDEEVNDDNDDDYDDDENLSESDENDRNLIDVEYHGNCKRAGCQCKVRTTGLSEKVLCAQNSHLESENMSYLDRHLKYKKQNVHICGSGLEHTGNQNSGFYPGNTSKINELNDKQEDKTYFEEDYLLHHDKFIDEKNQACNFNDSEGTLFHKSLILFETENNDCGELSSTENEEPNFKDSGETQTIQHARELKSASNKEKDPTSCFEVGDHFKSCDFTSEKKEVDKNFANEVDQKSQKSSLSEHSGNVFKDIITLKTVREQCPLKIIKTSREDDNRLKFDGENSENFNQTYESDGQRTCTICGHTNGKINFQEQLTEEAVDENQNIKINSDTTGVINDANDDSAEDDSVEIQKVGELQKNLKFEVESEDTSSAVTDNEFDESSDSEDDLNNVFMDNLDREEKLTQAIEFLTDVPEFGEKKLSDVFAVVSNAGSKLPGSLMLVKKSSCTNLEKTQELDNGFQIQCREIHTKANCKLNDFPVESCSGENIRNSDVNVEQISDFHGDDDTVTKCSENLTDKVNTQKAVSDQKHNGAQAGIILNQLEAECASDDQNEKEAEQFAKTGVSQALDSDLKSVNYLREMSKGNTDMGDQNNKENENVKVRLTSVLKRKQTKLEIDNRLAEISSDEEDDDNMDVKVEAASVANVKQTPKAEKRENEDVKHITFSSSNGPISLGSLGQIPGSLFRSFITSDSDIDFSLPPDEFMKQLQTKNAGLSGFLEKMKSENNIDYSLPPDEFRKQLQERHAAGLSGTLQKLLQSGDQSEHHSRPHVNRRAQRPQNAKSDFAASFYESCDQNVDIRQLGRQTSESSATFGNGQRGTNERTWSPSSTTGSENMEGNSPESYAERLVRLQERTDAEICSMFSSDSSDTSVPSSRSQSPVPSTEDDFMAVGKVNDIWLPVIQQEKTKCLQSARIPKNSRCTVLCVDVSASMQGSPWQQVKAFIPDFLSGLEEKRQRDNIEEYVAMVTFGCETRIVSQPTKNFGQLIDGLKSFKPDGNSPLLPGLALSLLFQTVRKELGQRHCQLHDIRLGHRIILLSDGRPSPSSQIGSSDEFLDEVQQQEAVQEVETSLQEWKLPSQHTNVDCVPVGESPNIDLLESICKATNGRLVVPADVHALVNSTHNHYMAAQVAKQMFQMKTDTLDLHMFKSLIQTLYPGTTSTDIAEMVALVEMAHARVLAQRQGGSETLSTTSEDDVHFEPSDLQALPKIGQRVCLGPHVTEKLLKFVPGKGVITGHSRKHRGKVFVQWDSGAHTLCNCGYKDKFEVFPDDTVEPCKIDDKIKIGYKVRRGPDWQYGNQDGGGDQLGTVYHIQMDGIVHVKWPNGNSDNYRYNQSGAFDVLISDPSDPFGTKMFVSEMNKRNKERSKTEVQLTDSVRKSTEKDKVLTVVN